MRTTMTMAPEPADVSFSGTCLGYGGELAVKDIDIHIEAGKIVMLLGPSGCGKSTLLRAVAGLMACQSGSVSVGGQRVTGPSAERAMMFQEDALLPWRSATANVELALQLRGMGRRERHDHALELLGQVGLVGFEHHLPRELSGGMRQRVQLARTLAMQPRVLLMDEPFGALDAQTRSSMQALLAAICEVHRSTIVFVTHDVDEALLVGDRVLVLTQRPATLCRTVEVPGARKPGWRFDPEFNRLRYEILAHLGQDDGPPAAGEIELDA
jgi:NitT/TauT family transport system ATP-binding protein